MEEKVFAGLLTWALVLAFIFSIEAIAQLQERPQKTSGISATLSGDLQVFNEQVP